MDENTVKKIREFNRYYTVWLEVLHRSYLGSGLSWAQARVIFEIYMYPGITATGVCEHLQMDKSYVSRILSNFEKKKMLTRESVPGSKGLKKLVLTNVGQKVAEQIDQSGSRQILDKLRTLDSETCVRLCDAMVFIENTLKKKEVTDNEQ